MGIDLGGLFPKQSCTFQDFRGKVVAIDAYNVIHQFLAIIRQRDGTPLKDASGTITSHLSGLFFRTSNLVEAGIKPVYVFDGTPHVLKARTIKERERRKEQAELAWKQALVDGDLATAKSKASQTSRMTEGILSQSKALLAALGIPVVQAPAEGEAQAAAMVCAGQAFAVGSQDFDSLLFGAPLLIRNLTSSEKRKLPGKQAYVKVHAEVIRLEDGLQALGLTRPQLVDMAILMGTDFNEGVKGLGPKKSLAAIKEAGSLEGVLASRPDVAIPLEDIHLLRNLFLHPDVISVPALRWSLPDRAAVLRLLCDEHQFSEERVRPALEKFEKAEYLRSQKSLFEF